MLWSGTDPSCSRTLHSGVLVLASGRNWANKYQIFRISALPTCGQTPHLLRQWQTLSIEEIWLTLDSFLQFSSVQFSHSVMSNSLWPHGPQHTRPPCPSPAPGAYSNSCPPSLWCHPTISSSVIPFSFCLQSFPASGSFQMSQFFIASSDQSIGVSASASVLPMNIHDWFPLGWMGWISLQSKGLSRVFSNTTVQKHQFFGVQLSLQPNSHSYTWPLEKP